VIQGVLRDGRENTANPTRNNIVVIPAMNNGFYTGMSEELFIEKDINWLRLRDVTLRYQLPERASGAGQRVRHGHGPAALHELLGPRPDRERQHRRGRRLGRRPASTSATSPCLAASTSASGWLLT
jgi:hypothetical protein